MANTISLYPTLNDRLKSKIILNTDLQFYFSQGQSKKKLHKIELDDNSNIFKLSDASGIWNCKENDFGIKIQCSIKHPNLLYGEEGIACENATLGIAIQWTSPSSKQRGAFKIGKIPNTTEQLNIANNHTFPKSSLRGTINFKILIFIESIGTPSENEIFLANTPGIILWESNKNTLVLDGEGTIFPIYEINNPQKPLWYLECDWDDPNIDLFSDSVSIFINRAHKNYKFLDNKSKVYNEQLLIEIFSSAYNIILNKLKEDNEFDFATHKSNANIGSVTNAIIYLIETRDWNISTPEQSSETLRKDLEKRILQNDF